MSFGSKIVPSFSSLTCRAARWTSGAIVLHRLPTDSLHQRSINRFFDIYQITNKEAIEKERARLEDELNRGYFADISELKKHGGKVGFANKTLIPTIAAKSFPLLVVEFTDGRKLALPLQEGKSADIMPGINQTANPHMTLLCLSFRANSQAMIDSWSSPFIEAFKSTAGVQLYEVSFIDSWLLSLNPIKRLLLRTMRKSENINGNQSLQRHVVYSFGDHYYLRKDLNILNLLTGYIFLLDKKGRIRWQGFGQASNTEVSSMLSCSSWLLEEQSK